VTGGGRGTTVATPTDASSAPPVTNVDRGGYNFPLGARSAPNPTGGTVHNSAPATVNHNPAPPTRGDAAVHGGARSNGRSGHAVRGWGQRRGGPPPARGTSQARPRDQDNPAPPPQSAPPRSNGGGREAGSQPRSSPAPRPEAPSGGGRSSGSTRGGRP
jgi:hypothetical protein